jgi:hypothetical protein
MSMHKKKTIICKYNLNGNCKFGNKCSFLHVQRSEIDRVYDQIIKLREKNDTMRNLKLHRTNNIDSSEYGVHA